MLEVWRRPFPHALWKPYSLLAKGADIVPAAERGQPTFDHQEATPGRADPLPGYEHLPGFDWASATIDQHSALKHLRDAHLSMGTLTKGRDFATFGALAAHQANAVARLYGKWKERGGNPLADDPRMPDLSRLELPYESATKGGRVVQVPQLTMTRNGQPFDMMSRFNKMVSQDRTASRVDNDTERDRFGNLTFLVSPTHGWLADHVARRFVSPLRQEGKHWIDTVMDPKLTWEHLVGHDRKIAFAERHGLSLDERTPIAPEELDSGLDAGHMPDHVKLLFGLSDHHQRLSSTPNNLPSRSRLRIVKD